MKPYLIEPCPFCGKKARYISYYDAEMNFIWHYVICSECHIKTQEKKTKRTAIKSWNRRNNEG